MPVDSPYTYDGQKYVIIDTAGIRKKGKVYESTEKYSVLRALRAIERSDVVLVVLNAEEGIIEQDKKIAGYAMKLEKALLLLLINGMRLKKMKRHYRNLKEKLEINFYFWIMHRLFLSRQKQKNGSILYCQ